MTSDIDTFRKRVKDRSSFYEFIRIDTAAIKQDGEWYNLHTDLKLLPEDAQEDKDEILGPVAYFSTLVEFGKFSQIFSLLFDGPYHGHQKPINFESINTGKGDKNWKNNTSSGGYIEFPRASSCASITIYSSETDVFDISQDKINRKLKVCNPPYRNINDFVKEHFGRTSHKWPKPRINCFAPYFLKIAQSRLKEDREFEAIIQSHQSIDPDFLTISTWANKNNEVVDRELHNELEVIEDKGPFKKYALSWTPQKSPKTVSVNLHHPEYKDIHDETKESSHTLFKSLSIVLGVSPVGVEQILSQDVASHGKGRDTTSTDYLETTVNTIFNLAGFNTVSPEHYKHRIDGASQAVPDILAYTESGYEDILVVCECTTGKEISTLEERGKKPLTWVSNLNNELERVKIVPVFATTASEEQIEESELPNKTKVLHDDLLEQMLKKARTGTRPQEILNRLSTNHGASLLKVR